MFSKYLNAILQGFTTTHKLPNMATIYPNPTHHIIHTKVGEKLSKAFFVPKNPVKIVKISKRIDNMLKKNLAPFRNILILSLFHISNWK